MSQELDRTDPANSDLREAFTVWVRREIDRIETDPERARELGDGLRGLFGHQSVRGWGQDIWQRARQMIEADLERHGRLWFGVTREVKPADVPALTKSLLEGARKEFPSGDLVASDFDPEGNKIGKAFLGKNGSIRWEQ